VAGSGRRRQVTTPLRRRVRRDVLVWGLVAGAAATLALGLTGGGWGKAVVLGLLVLSGCVLLTLLSATTSSKGPGAHSGPPPEGPPPSGSP
jgi:hypothetical protein